MSVYRADLREVYNQVYLLVHLGKFEAQYVEGISPAERELYIATHVSVQEEIHKDSNEEKASTPQASRLLGNLKDYTQE